MKPTVLLAVDTSGIYNHTDRVKDIRDALSKTCADAEIVLVTFDKRGIVHHNVDDFLNADMDYFMEEPAYKEIFNIFDDYDRQHMFASFVSTDVLLKEMKEYSIETFGFDVDAV